MSLKDVPEHCRQRLAAEGKAIAKSNCAVCGQFSPNWKECNVKIAGPVEPSFVVEQVSFTKPLSPSEVKDKAKTSHDIPDFVIHAVNLLLIEKYSGSKLFISQEDVVEAILRHRPSLDRTEIFDKKMLDFEHLFNENGWIVTHHKIFREPSMFSFEAK